MPENENSSTKDQGREVVTLKMVTDVRESGRHLNVDWVKVQLPAGAKVIHRGTDQLSLG